MAGKRVRDLGIHVGQFGTGPRNTIADVEGVRGGHADVSEKGLLTGLTAVVPCNPSAGRRKLFLGRWALDGGADLSGLQVAEDFGTLSGPIVLAPAPGFGGIYNGVISYGYQRYTALPIDAGWPPVVIGVNDRFLNDPRAETEIGEAELARCLASTGEGVAEGSRGIGRGLCAFGLRGGVGTASRLAGGSVIGALVAANGGERRSLRVNGWPVGAYLDLPEPEGDRPRSAFAVVATDAPMRPDQLGRLAERAALGLVRGGFIDGWVSEGQVLAFSTGNVLVRESGPVLEIRMVGEKDLPPLFEAAGEAADEAGLNALLAAEPASGLEVLSPDRLRMALERARG